MLPIKTSIGATYCQRSQERINVDLKKLMPCRRLFQSSSTAADLIKSEWKMLAGSRVRNAMR